MAKTMKLLLTSLFFLAAAYNIQAADQPLQCWHCSSDTIGAEDFCGTVFKENNIPSELMKERNISVIRTCNSTINSEHERAVCRKTVEETNGKTITKRFCYYTNKSDPLDHCSQDTTEKNVHRTFCHDCLSDKCNSATQVAAMFGSMLLPVLVAKIFAV